MKMTIVDEPAMLDFGATLANICAQGAIIYLIGELGVGKTTLARGFLRAFGHKGAIRSPTYTLVEHYHFSDVEVFHIDLYRLGHPEEIEYLGLTDLMTEDCVGLFEWPERGGELLPAADLICTMNFAEENSREVMLKAMSDRGTDILQKLS